MLANGTLHGGGAEHVIATLARELRNARHEVTIAVIGGGGEVQQELETERFDVLSRIGTHGKLALFALAARLRRIVIERGIDIVHTHDIRSLIDVGACRMTTRAFRHMHTFHFGNYPHLPKKHLLLETVFARIPDRLIAVGHAQRASLVSALHLSPARIETIWNGVEYPDVAIDPPGAPDVPVVGSISTFFPQKGLPTLLQAFRLVKDRGQPFRAVLVGAGPLRSELDAEVARLGLGDTVTFTGWVPDASRSMLPTFDIFVQSSYWEAMSVVILEAMAARRPILATTVGENPSVLKAEETAILVPSRNAEALADGLCRLLQDPERRKRLAEAAHRDYAANFTSAAMGQRYIDAYDRLAHGKG